MRSIGVVSVARSDYGIYRPVLSAIAADPTLRLSVFAGGTHLRAEHGDTIKSIEADGFPIAARIDTHAADDSPASVAVSMGTGAAAFALAFADAPVDLLVVLGDRYEMFAAAAAAAAMLQKPLAHIHGGERTEGAIDEAFRHSITKMSHLHFVSTADHARRVRQLGEEAWRVTVSGAPALDHLRNFQPMPDEALAARVTMPLEPRPLLVTFHPATIDGDADGQVAELLAALAEVRHPIVFTHPNADAGGGAIAAAIRAFVAATPRARLVASLGTHAYFSLMARALAMVGNSSSGIIEAASFGLPVVNIGNRQQGRTRGANVVDVACERRAITGAITEVTTASWRDRLAGGINPYGDGHAAPRIVDVLRAVPIDRRLMLKPFVDICE